MNRTYNRCLEGVLRRLRRVGVDIRPCLLVREDLPGPPAAEITIDPQFRFCQLNEDDLPGIHRLRPGMSLERYRDFLRSGKLCYGLKDGDRLVAKMWIDLERINSVLYNRPLETDEAYLFDAFADEAYRGRNLAPYLRQRCYGEVRARGRRRIYSISEFTNTPARRFKAKLGAVDVALIVFWKVPGFASRRWIVRRYPLAGSRSADNNAA